MSSQKKIGIAIFAALAIGVGGYFGYQHYASVPTAQEAAASVEKIGILDSMRAVKAHPRYGELETIEREMAQIQAELQQKIARGQAMSMPSGLHMNISNSMVAGEQALRTEANQKLAAKETELNKRMAEIELAKKNAAQEELMASLQQISDEYKMKIFNLELKIKTLTLEDNVRTVMEQQKIALEQEQNAKMQSKADELRQKLTTEMQAEVQAAHAEMDAYVQQISEEYGILTAAKSEAANAEMMAKLQKMNRKLEKEVKAGEAALAEKKKQHDEIMGMIVQDIKQQVAQIAETQGLTVVIDDVRMNIAAVDVTDAIIAAYKEQQ